MNFNNVPEKRYGIGDVAEILGFSRSTVRNLIHRGHIKALLYPGTGKFLIPESELARYVDSAKQVGPEIEAPDIAAAGNDA